MASLFDQVKLGQLTLKNRIVMASLTRNRSNFTLPGDNVSDYYSQRSDAGLIISEGVLIAPQGTEWPAAPGIYSDAQVTAWRKLNKSIHAKNGVIFAQLWHLGRVCHPLHQCGQPAVGPSAVAANGGKFRYLAVDGAETIGYVTPVAIENPKDYVKLYRKAAENAKSAGFDGVEFHCANGYLPNQFLDSSSNKRTDEFGGSIENRCRFALDCIKELIEVYGDSKRVGIKLSPQGGYNDVGETIDEARRVFTYLVQELDKLNIGYIQLSNSVFGSRNQFDITELRPLIKKSLVIYNGNYNAETGKASISNGDKSADLIAFGRPFIANPDLVERIKSNKPLAEIDWMNVYGVIGADGSVLNPVKGYSDYPRA